MSKLNKLLAALGTGALALSLASCGKDKTEPVPEQPQEPPVVEEKPPVVEDVPVADGDLMKAVTVLKDYVANFDETNWEVRRNFNAAVNAANVLADQGRAQNKINDIEYNAYKDMVVGYSVAWTKLNVKEGLENAFDTDAMTITTSVGEKNSITALSRKLNNMYSTSEGKVNYYVDSNYTYDGDTFVNTSLSSDVSNEISGNYAEMIDTLFEGEKLEVTYSETTTSSTYDVSGVDENNKPYSVKYQIKADKLDFMGITSFKENKAASELYSFANLDLQTYSSKFRGASDFVYQIKYAPKVEEPGKE